MSTQWYMKTDAEELGPLSFEELIVLVNAGALGEEDFVRPTSHVAWQRARSVPGLFSAPPDPLPGSAWSETVNSALASVDARRKGAQRHSASKTGGHAGPAFARRGASLGRGVLGVFSLLTGGASSFVELALALGEGAWRSRIMRGLVVVTTLAMAAYLGYSAIPASWFLSTTSALQTVEGIGRGIKELQGRGANKQERQAFADETHQELARIVPLLEQQASHDQAARELMYAARDCLPKMMAAPADSSDPPAIERRFASHLVRVKRIHARKPPKPSAFDATTVGIVVVDVVIVAALIRAFVRK